MERRQAMTPEDAAILAAGFASMAAEGRRAGETLRALGAAMKRAGLFRPESRYRRRYLRRGRARAR